MAYKNYSATFYSQRNNRYDIEIWSKSTTSTGATFQTGKDGFKLSYKGSDDRNKTTKPSECSLSFIVANSTDETYINNILTSDDKEHFIIVRRNFVIFWWGGLKAGFDSLENNYFPYFVKLKATDYIGDFINTTNEELLASDTLLVAGVFINSFTSHIGFNSTFLPNCFPRGINETINGLNNRWYGEGQTKLAITNPFAQQKINAINFSGNDPTKYSPKKGLKAYLKTFGLMLFQAEGKIFCIQPYSYTDNTIEIYRKSIGNANEYISTTADNQNITPTQFVSDNLSSTPSEVSGFTGNVWLQNPANFTTWSSSGSVTSITATSFNIALTSTYMYVDLVEGSYRVSFSQNDVTTRIVYANTSGSDNVILTESGEANFSIGSSGGRLKIMATTTGTKSVEYIGLQKGDFDERRFLSGQILRYLQPYGKVSTKFDYGSSIAAFIDNNMSVINSPHTTLSVIGAVGANHLDGAIFNTSFSYSEKFDYNASNPTIYRISGTIVCKLKIGTQYLTGTADGVLSWTAIDSTFSIVMPYIANFTTEGSNGDYFLDWSEGPTLTGPMWYGSNPSDAGSLAKIMSTLSIALPTIPAAGSISFQFVSGLINYFDENFDPYSGAIEPTPTTSLTKANLLNRFSNTYNTELVFLEETGETMQGIDFSATTPNLDNFKSFDLGSMPIGITSDADGNEKSLFIVNPSTFESQVASYVRVNDTGTTYNPASLLSKEYIDLQSEPLEIIEGQFYTNDFSAFRVLLLNSEKYVFSEGTFTAASDTIDGSWYKLQITSESVTLFENEDYSNPTTPEAEPTPSDPNPTITPTLHPNTTPINVSDIISIGGVNHNIIQTIKNNIRNNKILGVGKMFDSVGLTAVDINANSAITTITLLNDQRGKLFNNQKLILSKNDFSHPILLTKNGDQTNQKGISFTSFTPTVNYKIGSVLSVVVSDLSNVITGTATTPAGSDSQIQFNDSGAFGADGNFVLLNNKLGVGTASPSTKLEILDTTSSILRLVNTEANYGANQQSIDFWGKWWSGNASDLKKMARIAAEHRADGFQSGNLKFFVMENAVEIDAMTILYDGKVGIGIAAPTEALDVVGNIKCSADIHANEIVLTGTSAGITIDTDGTAEILFPQVDSANITSSGNLFLLTAASGKYISLGTEGINFQVVLKAGKLGIGTSSPTQALDVVGSINASGKIEAGTVFRGSNIGTIQNDAIHLTPQDFNLFGESNNGVYTGDSGGSVQAGTAARDIYAMFFIPDGYKIISVEIYSNSTDPFVMNESSIENATITQVASGNLGTAVTSLNITPSSTRIYYVLEVNIDSTADKIYGGKIGIQRI